MAKKEITKAELLAASAAAARSGRTWAQRFIELVREQPQNYALQGWIDDAEHCFKGNADELNDFYMTIQSALLDSAKKPAYGGDPLMAESKYTLDHDQVKEIRNALLIGLASFGEIERLVNARDLLKMAGYKAPKELRAIHPTGAADTASLFAAALRDLEYSKQPEAS